MHSTNYYCGLITYEIVYYKHYGSLTCPCVCAALVCLLVFNRLLWLLVRAYTYMYIHKYSHAHMRKFIVYIISSTKQNLSYTNLLIIKFSEIIIYDI